MADVLSALATARVRAVAVKGIVLAQTLYDDVANRPIQDVDLRIVPEDLPRAMAAMRERGWEMRRASRQTGAVGVLHPHALVELETSIGPPGLCLLSVATVLERAHLRSRPSGVVCLEPEIHDHAVLLVVNAFKDKIVMCPAPSLRDTSTIVSSPGFDIEIFCDRIRTSKSTTMASIVGEHLASHSAKWREILERLGPTPRPLYKGAFEGLLRHAPKSLALRIVGRLGSDALSQRIYALGASTVGSALAWARGYPLSDG